MDVRRLVYFSLFLSVYSATSVILIDFFGAEDQVLGIIIALFFPFIGLKYYKYFLIYRGIMIMTGFPSFVAAIKSVGTSFYTLGKSDLFVYWYYDNYLITSIILIIFVYIESYFLSPFISYRVLKKIGFYRRINSILGEFN